MTPSEPSDSIRATQENIPELTHDNCPELTQEMTPELTQESPLSRPRQISE